MPKMPKIKTLPKSQKDIVLPSKRNSKGYFDCCYCDKAISRKYDLERHVKDVHINAKEYRCAREGKGCDFAGANQKGNLTQHYKISPLCEEARRLQEDELEETTPAVKVEVVSPELFHQWQPISATARASRDRTAKRSARRTAPYSTSARRGPPPSEASSSQSPEAHASYQAQSYETLAMNNFFDQNFQAQAPALSDAFYQIPQSPVAQQNNGFLSSPDANNLFMDDPFTASPVQPEPLFLAPAVDPTPHFYAEPTPTFDCSNSSTDSSFSYRDGTHEELIAASRATGKIDYLPPQDASSSQNNTDTNANSWSTPVNNSMALALSGSSNVAPQALDESLNFQNNGWNNENFQNVDWNNGVSTATEQEPAENSFSNQIFDWDAFLNPMMTAWNGVDTDAFSSSTAPLSSTPVF